jgi:methyl-accepting chemotaxis protein
MFRNWTFGRKVGAGFAATAVALVIIAVTGYRSTKTLIDTNRLVTHTQAVRAQIATLLVNLLNAETGQRGFVITGRDDFLTPYSDALPVIDSTYADLRRLVADNPSQLARLDQLRASTDAKLAELRKVIDLRRTSSEAAVAIVNNGTGKQYMDTARQIVKAMDDDETELLLQRNHDAEVASEFATTIMLWGSVAATLAAIVLGWLITASLSKQIGAVVRNMKTSSTELQTAANQQASGASEQATAMTEIATTISELLATSRQIAQSAQRVAQIAQDTATTARTGATVVARGNDASLAVRRQVDLVVQHMLELGKKSQQVGAVLDIVSELAEQTNILAINATIEAAGAGEAGRRFGVVADEIRNLADRVGASTKEIRAMVEDVRSAVNTTVMATEAGSKAVEAGAGQVTEMATAFTQIAGLVGTTTDAAREIELSTKQQATAVEQVNVAITNVTQATRETETSAAQTLQTSRQLATLSTELLQLVQSA